MQARHIWGNLRISQPTLTAWRGRWIIRFIKEDKAQDNKLTVVSVDPSELDWSDVELTVDWTAVDHGLMGTVTAGDILDISALAGTGSYTISIRHIPTNDLLGSYAFISGVWY